VSSDCRLRAEYYLRMARECDDPETADALRALAAEYVAEETEGSASIVQQYQQIEPKGKRVGRQVGGLRRRYRSAA
jgi:hypothetical protein